MRQSSGSGARTRCPWAVPADPLYISYHDTEWGVPSRDARHLFEMLVLEGAQSGLSWSTILHKRDGYRRAFARFDAARVARFTDKDIARLLGDASIVRNRSKIEAAIANARAVCDLGEPLDEFLWRLAGGAQKVNRFRTARAVPAQTPVSHAMSKELKRAGFRFVGPTVCYAFMQATGMVNDHLAGCFRHAELSWTPSI